MCLNYALFKLFHVLVRILCILNTLQNSFWKLNDPHFSFDQIWASPLQILVKLGLPSENHPHYSSNDFWAVPYTRKVLGICKRWKADQLMWGISYSYILVTRIWPNREGCLHIWLVKTRPITSHFLCQHTMHHHTPTISVAMPLSPLYQNMANQWVTENL